MPFPTDEQIFISVIHQQAQVLKCPVEGYKSLYTETTYHPERDARDQKEEPLHTGKLARVSQLLEKLSYQENYDKTLFDILC